MRWRGRRESDNVIDVRGSRGYGGGGGMRMPIGGGGGLGIGALVIIGVVIWLMGGNPLVVLDAVTGGGGGMVTTDAPRDTTSTAGRDDDERAFVSVVLGETETVWSEVFRQSGRTYEEPKLVMFSSQVNSACGFASAATGPFYCPNDRRVFLDTSFFQELARRFGAPGDFAQAYVIAHEVGHHVQNLIGVLPKFNQQRASMSERDANAMSVKVELQADCFAGVWSHYVEKEGLLEVGDIDEALAAAQAVGDDTLQRKTQGYVVPESFNHGTSAQRSRWFRAGYEAGDPGACDTFGADRL